MLGTLGRGRGGSRGGVHPTMRHSGGTPATTCRGRRIVKKKQQDKLFEMTPRKILHFRSSMLTKVGKGKSGLDY